MKIYCTGFIFATFCMFVTSDLFADTSTTTAPGEIPTSQEAILACQSLKDGDTCKFVQNNTKMTGTCQKDHGDKLTCILKIAQ